MSGRKREIAGRQPPGFREIFYKRLPRPCICSILGLHVGKSAKFFDLVYHFCCLAYTYVSRHCHGRTTARTYMLRKCKDKLYAEEDHSGSRSIHDTRLISLCALSISDNLHFIGVFFHPLLLRIFFCRRT